MKKYSEGFEPLMDKVLFKYPLMILKKLKKI